MKIRNGFVSNSSSSSFVIAFDGDPNDVEYLKNRLFDGQDEVEGLYGDGTVSTDDACAHILSVLNASGHPVDVLQIADEIRGYECDPRMPSRPDYFDNKGDYDALYQKYQKQSMVASLMIAEDFIAKNGKDNVYILEFSDDSSIGSFVEHGDFLTKLPVIVVNKH